MDQEESAIGVEIKYIREHIDELKSNVDSIVKTLHTLEVTVSELKNRTVWSMIDYKLGLVILAFILLSGAAMGQDIWTVVDMLISNPEAIKAMTSTQTLL